MRQSIFLLLLLSLSSYAQTLRILEVVPEAGEGIEEIFLNGNPLLVKTASIVSDKDVQFAAPKDAQSKGMLIHLSPAGGEKMKAVTSRLRAGVDRMAVVLDGRVLIAPTVNGVLGRDLDIPGMADFSVEEVDDLARKISGRPPRKPGEDIIYALKPEPPVEAVPGLLKSSFKDGKLPDAEWSPEMFFKNLQIPDPKQEVNETDLRMLITLIYQLHNYADKEVVLVDTQSDLFRTLAHNFPEVSALQKASKGKKIPFRDIATSLELYRLGANLLKDLLPTAPPKK